MSYLICRILVVIINCLGGFNVKGTYNYWTRQTFGYKLKRPLFRLLVIHVENLSIEQQNKHIPTIVY